MPKSAKVPRGRALADALVAIPPDDRDAWIDNLLGIEPPPPDGTLPKGGVPYLPCGVDEILAVVRDAKITATDHVVDLGAGVGRVAILIHLLTGARTGGIEIQRHLVARARETIEAHGLDISMQHGDVAECELDASVFFLYAPFNGALLARVLAKLQRLAEDRPFRICTVDLELDVDWLVPRPSRHRAVAIYETAARHS